MDTFKAGDKVRIKDRTDWPSPPGYRFAGTEGTVVNWFVWEEPMNAFFPYVVHVHIEKSPGAKEYLGNDMPFPVENLEKI